MLVELGYPRPFGLSCPIALHLRDLLTKITRGFAVADETTRACMNAGKKLGLTLDVSYSTTCTGTGSPSLDGVFPGLTCSLVDVFMLLHWLSCYDGKQFVHIGPFDSYSRAKVRNRSRKKCASSFGTTWLRLKKHLIIAFQARKNSRQPVLGANDPLSKAL